MSAKSNFLIWTLFIFIFFVLVLKANNYLDPDFGWHLKVGEIALSSGIPKLDPFSYSMPSFHFINHEWATDTFLKLSYDSLGFFGLSLIFATALILAIYVSFRRDSKSLPFWEVPVILGIGTLLPYFALRPQVLSWLLWAIFLALILNRERWSKWKFFLPPFFMVWANFHGSFAAGIAALVLLGIFRYLKERKLSWSFTIITLLCLLSTLINPYGPRIWKEIWLSISDASLRWRIAEWQPAFFSINLPFILYFVISSFLIWKNKRGFKLDELGLFFFFAFWGLSSKRNVPLWVILSIPMTIKAFSLMLTKIKIIPQAEVRFKKAYNWTLYFSISAVFLQALGLLLSLHTYKEETYYPKEAVSYLSNNLPKGEIFSIYRWGGYLIWKLPEKKVFVDGRMPSWRTQNSPESESENAMRDYTNLVSGFISYKDIFNKYGVTVVLWEKSAQKGSLDTLPQRFEKVIWGRSRPFDFISDLEKDGWDMVYEDNVSVIFVSAR